MNAYNQKNYKRNIKEIIKEGKYLDDELLLQFFSDENHFQKPEHRFNGEKPRIAVIFDDMLGSGIYSRPRKLNGLSTEFKLGNRKNIPSFSTSVKGSNLTLSR